MYYIKIDRDVTLKNLDDVPEFRLITALDILQRSLDIYIEFLNMRFLVLIGENTAPIYNMISETKGLLNGDANDLSIYADDIYKNQSLLLMDILNKNKIRSSMMKLEEVGS